MKSSFRGRSAIVELTIALIFFTLCACILVRVFAAGRSAADESVRLTKALTRAQSYAEAWQALGTERFSESRTFAKQENGSYTKQENGFTVCVTVSDEKTAGGILSTGRLTVSDENGVLAELSLGRYEARYE